MHLKTKLVGGVLAATLLVCSASAATMTKVDCTVSPQWFATTQEATVSMADSQSRMVNAHAMAESARALGLDESNEVIQTAKAIWTEANNEYQTCYLQATTNHIVNTTDLTATGLTTEAFDIMLAGSKLAGHGQDFYDLEQQYGVSGVFAIAVAKVESGLGNSTLAVKKNNYYGMLGCSYASQREGILAFGKLMNAKLYKDKTLNEIARVYCPPTANEWAQTVRSCMATYWAKLSV